MKDRKARRASWQRLALSGDFSGMPPGGKVRGAAATPRREPTLTKKFNTAAKKQQVSKVVTQPFSKQQIVELQKRLSQPRLTNDRSTFGTINNSYAPKRDRKILDQLEAIQTALSKLKGKARSDFAKVQLQGKAKTDFNRASGMSM